MTQLDDQINEITFQQDERFARLGHISPEIRYQLWTFTQGPFAEHPLEIRNFETLNLFREYFAIVINMYGEKDFVLEMLQDWITEPSKKWLSYLEQNCEV